MNAPTKSNIYALANRALKVLALVEAIDHVCNAQNADAAARIRFVEALTEERWSTLAQIASTKHRKTFGNPSQTSKEQVLAAFRARVAPALVKCPACDGAGGGCEGCGKPTGCSCEADWSPCGICDGQCEVTPDKADGWRRWVAEQKARREAEAAARLARIPTEDIPF